MTLGALAMSAAYLMMYLAPNIWLFSVGFGVLGGAAVSLLGVTPVTTLVGRWFPTGSGRALGIAFMPILVTILPAVAGLVTARYGWRTTLLTVAVTALALIPVFRLVRDPPNLAAVPANLQGDGARPRGVGFKPDGAFWMLALGVGLLDGSGITIITHIVPYATELGVSYQQATLLVSIMGICGLVGAPLLGFLADRAGGPTMLSVVVALLMAGWLALTLHPPYLLLAAVMGLLGLCGSAFAGLLGTSLANRYPGAALGPAIGLAVMCALPFNFVLPLLAGFAHDKTGTYRWTFLYQVALFAVALWMFLQVARRARRNAIEPASTGSPNR